MIEIHCRMSDSELNRYGTQIGEMIYPDMVAQRYDHACSDLISMQMISVIADISCVCNHSYSDIIKSIPIMTRWINYKKIAQCIRTACEKWFEPTASIVFDESFLSTNLEEYPRQLQEDMCVFCGWAIYRGADGASIRKGIPSDTQKHIRSIIKNRVENGVINRLWRAMVSFISFSEKAIEPYYSKALKGLKHGIKQEAGFNTMRNAFSDLRGKK